MKFQTIVNDGRPMIVWDQKGPPPKSKKIDYKKKENKIPLRAKGRQQPQASVSQSQTALKKTTADPVKNPLKSTIPNKHPKADTVTLTQTEFDAILATIGQLVSENGEKELKKSEATGSGNAAASSDKPDAAAAAAGGSEGEAGGREEMYFKLSPRETQASSPGRATDTSVRPKNTATQMASASATMPKSFVAPTPAPATQTVSAASPAATIPGLPPKPPPTKMEQRRLKWEKERDELSKIEGYNPWGRPGAGAPIKDGHGEVLSDYNSRKDVLLRQSLEAPPNNQQHAPQGTVPPPFAMTTTSPTTTAAALSRLGGEDQAVPAAMRTSFTIGAVAPDENKFQTVKERQKKEWLEELEHQRQDQRRHKEEEKRQQNQQELQDTWADRFTAYKPQGLPDQSLAPPHSTVDDARAALGAVRGEPGDSAPGRAGSAPVATAQKHDDSPYSYLRGQNVPVNDALRREMEEKKRKNVEYQEAVSRQIAEKERLKREDREKKIKEELEDELRLQRERDSQQGLITQEGRKTRLKEEEQQRRLDVLKEAMEQAQFTAEREKHDKRMRKLQRAGHDVSQLHANFEAKMTPRVGAATSTTSGPSLPLPDLAALALYQTPRDATHVEPTYIPGLHPTPRDAAAAAAVATPTADEATHRADAMRSHRNPTTSYSDRAKSRPDLQTDTQTLSRESTDVVYRGPIEDPKKTSRKRVQVKSAPRSQTRTLVREEAPEPRERAPIKISERPRWGGGGQKKKVKHPIKQSERDPFYEQTRDRARALRTQRQAQLKELSDREAPPVARRTRSKSRDRDPSPAKNNSRVDMLTLHNLRDPSPERESSRSDGRSRSKEESYRSTEKSRGRSSSPPVPAVKHRFPNDQAYNYNYDESARSGVSPSLQNKYLDAGPIAPPARDFVPFIRSSNVLDPAQATEPLPMSREPSVMYKARQAYMHEHNPARYGLQMNNRSDPSSKEQKDPIMNPAMVTEHPTTRQDRILQQLGDLRRGLMLKQKEYSEADMTAVMAQ